MSVLLLRYHKNRRTEPERASLLHLGRPRPGFSSTFLPAPRNPLLTPLPSLNVPSLKYTERQPAQLSGVETDLPTCERGMR